jgi:hypothetical protein
VRFQLFSKPARRLLAVFAVTTVGWLARAQPALATPKPEPTLTLTPVCVADGNPVFQVWPSGTGWPPNTLVWLKALSGYFAIPGAILGSYTDASGSFGGFGIGLFGPDWGFTTVEAWVDANNNYEPDPDEIHAIARIDNPCGPPTLTKKEQCKDSGYITLAFKVQGECVAYVEPESKP